MQNLDLFQLFYCSTLIEKKKFNTIKILRSNEIT